MEVFDFCLSWSLASLKVCDLKLLCLSQLCGLKDWIVKVGNYMEKYDRRGSENFLDIYKLAV